MSILAAVRPDSWNFPLFLHVLGAMILVGGLLTGVSSLAFAAAHTEPAHIILVFPLGLLFGWLRKRTDSLLPSLVAHIANNALALVAAAYLDG